MFWKREAKLLVTTHNSWKGASVIILNEGPVSTHAIRISKNRELWVESGIKQGATGIFPIFPQHCPPLSVLLFCLVEVGHEIMIINTTNIGGWVNFSFIWRCCQYILGGKNTHTKCEREKESHQAVYARIIVRARNVSNSYNLATKRNPIPFLEREYWGCYNGRAHMINTNH